MAHRNQGSPEERPDLGGVERRLDEAIAATFPCSDPIAFSCLAERVAQFQGERPQRRESLAEPAGRVETRSVAKTSAGLLPYRRAAGAIEVLLVHPGGPFWARKDAGAWSIPKGEIDEDENALAAARREFTEETGFVAEGDATPLTPVRQPGGKLVHAWAVPIDVDPAHLRSNTFTIEWPPRSGRRQEFPEVDRAAWFSLEEAASRILRGQARLLVELAELLDRPELR